MGLETRPLRFVRAGRIVEIDSVSPNRTLLQWLRDPAPGGAGCTGTKEGCAEGDCGACTVVLGELERGEAEHAQRLRYRAVNACIRPLASIEGTVLWTVEDLSGPSDRLHPAQQAMLQSHASQCGFCTPGFVMTLFAAYHERRSKGLGPVSRAQAQKILAGNLCRCTGYRPIVEAAQAMFGLPDDVIDEAQLIELLRQIGATPAPNPERRAGGSRLQGDDGVALRPRTTSELLQARDDHPQAQVVAGCTDVGLWITKQHQRFAMTLDTTGVDELQAIEQSAQGLRIGAGVRLAQAWDALCAQRPELSEFAARFAGPPIRNSGTLAGNIANASPIGDSMPVLIALGASVHLQSNSGARDVPLESFYTGYRRTVIGADELITWINVPAPEPGEMLRAYKISKRFEDDISAVCLALAIQSEGGHITAARIGAGGVAATPARARQAEAALIGKALSEETLQKAGMALQAEFTPIDDMRASAWYRREVLAALMLRFWHETQGHTINLERTDTERLALWGIEP